jgi:hypothetical protein
MKIKELSQKLDDEGNHTIIQTLAEVIINTEKQANDIVGDLFTRLKRAKLSLSDSNFIEGEEPSEETKLELSAKAEMIQNIIELTKNEDNNGDSSRRRKHFATNQNLDVVNYSDIAATHDLKVNEYKDLTVTQQVLIL